MTAVADALYFAPDDGRHGVEAWTSRGTPETTKLVADVNQDSASSRPFGFVQAGNQLFFFATDPRFGLSIYRNPAASGVRRLGVASSSGAVALGQRLLFLGLHHGSGSLWITDGTIEGTVPLDTRHSSGPLYSIGQLTRVGRYVYFTGGNGSIDGLWKTDGTPEGTALVRAGVSPKMLTAAGDLVFFLSRGEADYDLWVSDGTHDGTKLLQAKAPGSPGSILRRLCAAGFDDRFRAAAIDLATVPSMARSCGSATARRTGRGCSRTSYRDSSPRSRVGDTVYFVAGGWQGGFGVIGQPTDAYDWNGARDTARQILRKWSGPNHLIAVGDQLFFVGGDGYGLWRTDGTLRGTASC